MVYSVSSTSQCSPSISPVSRRRVLAGLAAGGAALLTGGLRSAFAAAASDQLSAIFGRSRLGGESGAVVMDVASGRIIEGHRMSAGLTPASVLKLMTTAYALDALGPGYRFRTRVLATGPVVDGQVQGDLVLAGDGDPTLDTNGLKALAGAVAARGVTGITGRFLVAEGALPPVEAVDAGQPMHVGYNPAISGLNLNFNRVLLDWAPGKKGPKYGFLAPGSNFEVGVSGIGGTLGEAPPPRHRMDGTREIWDLPKSKMTKAGKLWLPVRRPAAYGGEVFQRLAADTGLTLPEPVVVFAVPAGDELAGRDSAALEAMLRGMLRYSTNLTAEIVGLRASQARGLAPAGVEGSAAAMTAWARVRYGLETAAFVNHSGLSDRSVWSPVETARVLAAEADVLPPLMKPQGVHDAEGRPLALRDVQVSAKTGTLYFSSGLGGYIEGRGRRLAFAVYSTDPVLRADILADAPSAPPGSRGWVARARGVQRALLRRWVTLYMPEAPLRPLPRRI